MQVTAYLSAALDDLGLHDGKSTIGISSHGEDAAKHRRNGTEGLGSHWLVARYKTRGLLLCGPAYNYVSCEVIRHRRRQIANSAISDYIIVSQGLFNQ